MRISLLLPFISICNDHSRMNAVCRIHYIVLAFSLGKKVLAKNQWLISFHKYYSGTQGLFEVILTNCDAFAATILWIELAWFIYRETEFSFAVSAESLPSCRPQINKVPLMTRFVIVCTRWSLAMIRTMNIYSSDWVRASNKFAQKGFCSFCHPRNVTNEDSSCYHTKTNRAFLSTPLGQNMNWGKNK